MDEELEKMGKEAVVAGFNVRSHEIEVLEQHKTSVRSG